MHLLAQLLEVFLNTVHITGYVVHYNVESCIIGLLLLIFLLLLFQAIALLLWHVLL